MTEPSAPRPQVAARGLAVLPLAFLVGAGAVPLSFWLGVVLLAITRVLTGGVWPEYPDLGPVGHHGAELTALSVGFFASASLLTLWLTRTLLRSRRVADAGYLRLLFGALMIAALEWGSAAAVMYLDPWGLWNWFLD